MTARRSRTFGSTFVRMACVDLSQICSDNWVCQQTTKISGALPLVVFYSFSLETPLTLHSLPTVLQRCCAWNQTIDLRGLPFVLQTALRPLLEKVTIADIDQIDRERFPLRFKRRLNRFSGKLKRCRLDHVFTESTWFLPRESAVLQNNAPQAKGIFSAFIICKLWSVAANCPIPSLRCLFHVYF